MISDRDVSELASRVNSGDLSLDVYDVKISPPGAEEVPLNTPVEITLEEGHLCCRIRLFETTEIPESLWPLLGQGDPAADIMGIETCYRITGTTAEGMGLEMAKVWPRSVQTHYTGASTTHQFHFNRLSLPASHHTSAPLVETADGLQNLDPLPPESATKLVSDQREIEQFIAIIPGVKLLVRSDAIKRKSDHPYHGTSDGWDSSCFVGDLLGGKFCLETKDRDLWVFYRREIPETASTSLPARQIFSGLLDAAGYIHGCQPWPYFLEYRRDFCVVERWVDATKDCQSDVLPPMRKGRLAHGNEAQALFSRAAEFFATESKEANLFTRSLWLMREACRERMPLEIRLITLCSILEGLIHYLEKGLLSPAEREKTRREKWQAITFHLGLPWIGTFDLVFRYWNSSRHPLAHGFQERSETTDKGTFQAYSRITAAIYLIMASRMGYSGSMDSSVLEGSPSVSIGGGMS